jgi:hypothetical protein
MADITKETLSTWQGYIYGKSAYTVQGSAFKTDSELLTQLQALSDPVYQDYYKLYYGYNMIDYNTGRDSFNYCKHTRHSYGYYRTCPVVYQRDRGDNLYDYHWRRGSAINPNSFSSTFLSNNFGYPPVLDITDEMKKLAWENLMPQLNDGFSMANFLFELRDIKSMFSLSRKLTQYVKVLSGKVLATKTLAEIVLLYSFALKPMASDIQALYEDLLNTNKRVNEFIDRGRQVQSYHYKVRVEGSVTDVTPEGYEFGEHCQLETTVDYFATLRASYEYEKPSELEGFLRVMGLRLTPEVIWNAIPFSFLVDWIYRVGDFLRQFDKDPNLTVNIKDYCDTFKSVRSLKVFRKVDPFWYDGKYYTCRLTDWADYDHLDRDSLLVWSWEKSRYLRVPGNPNLGYALPALDSLSARELVLSGALLRANT